MDYTLLCRQLDALSDSVRSGITVLANASALLFHSLPDLNWAGFYLVHDRTLRLGPFQGRPACTEIPFGKGVCGQAWEQGRALCVTDVHAFPGHIACDSASSSEIVIPLQIDEKTVGVLDLDSPLPGRFTEQDQTGLEEFCRTLETCLSCTEEYRLRNSV